MLHVCKATRGTEPSKVWKEKGIRLDPCNLTEFQFYARRDTTAIFVNLWVYDIFKLDYVMLCTSTRFGRGRELRSLQMYVLVIEHCEVGVLHKFKNKSLKLLIISSRRRAFI